MRFEIKNIVPMGAVRTTQRQKFVDPRAKKYFEYKSLIYSQVLEQLKGDYEPLNGVVEMIVTFWMPIPASWSNKKKEAARGVWHTKKADIDNLTKGLFDALNGLIFTDDNRVASMTVYKFYSIYPGIEFEVKEIGEAFDNGQAKAKKEVKQSSKGKKKAT